MHRYARIHALQFDPAAIVNAVEPAETNGAGNARAIGSLRSAIAWHLWLARGARRSAVKLERRVASGRSLHPATARRLAAAYRSDAANDDRRIAELRQELTGHPALPRRSASTSKRTYTPTFSESTPHG
ncbi:hypothetical protein ACW0US_17540 [Xanthomonas euvesicatoria]